MKPLDAIGLDEILAKLTTAANRAAIPGPLLDAFASAITRGAATFGTTPMVPLSHNEIPDWLRLSLLDTYVAWETGRLDTCLHRPSPQRPDAAFAAAWTPGLVVCVACRGMLAPRPENHCDGCGQLPNGNLHPVTVAFASLAYGAGVCSDCCPGWKTPKHRQIRRWWQKLTKEQ
ncbi:hypothetical protein [Mycobacterium avium]|uniref:hypothetical protein n=1 Tax=Mycobacterium avium TaxID=1764 RepID=UPI001CC5CB17|nr:hypothetical protein [Mycobacterium avium]MBZ4580993.1 hypothetical protein [Mycobacterium avium subsp. hominissuis]MBZ4608916.1 hypothetical protein [Mycobacterium avium subsp. hominissuis]